MKIGRYNVMITRSFLTASTERPMALIVVALNEADAKANNQAELGVQFRLFEGGAAVSLDQLVDLTTAETPEEALGVINANKLVGKTCQLVVEDSGKARTDSKGNLLNFRLLRTEALPTTVLAKIAKAALGNAAVARAKASTASTTTAHTAQVTF